MKLAAETEQGVLHKLRKLRGRSAAELRVRGAQALHARAERTGLSAQRRVPTDQAFFRLLDRACLDTVPLSAAALLRHFRTRTTPVCFAAFTDPAATRAMLQQRFAGAASDLVLARAQAVRAGKFDLLGQHALDFGAPVDWQLEPTSGLRTPLVHWSEIDFLDPQVAGDKKFIWELNRQQHFMTLGRAYWRTGDEAYAETFAAHVAAWLDANPPKLGINWASSLEVAFRAISWLWAIYFFKDAPALTPALFLRLLKSLYAHARHIETYLSTYFSPNTHLTGEALGLYYLGTLLPEFKRAAHWRTLGRRVLLEQLDRHIKPDGVYLEHSTYYQRYTADFYTHFRLLARANDEPLSAGAARQLQEKLTTLLEHLLYVTRPDGTTPYIGDDDGGRLASLDDRAPDDFRATLATGAALFARSDYKHVAGDAPESLLWLLGPDGLQAYDALAAHEPAALSRAFPDGGYYVLRDGWTRAANYMLIDGGPHGAAALNYGHAHADALAFDLAAAGRTLLVDPGTYTYTGASEWRDHFRRSQAHNTLTIDDESSSVPAGPFRWQHVAHARTDAWRTTARFDYFAAAHDGYQRLAAPATHARSVLFLKRDYWLMRDRVETTGAHRSELSFHFAHAAMPELAADAESVVRVTHPHAGGLELYAFAPGGAWQMEMGWVSPAYGARLPAQVCKFAVTGTGAQEFITVLLPVGAGQSATRTVREMTARGGRAFALHVRAEQAIRGDARDVLLVKAGDAAEHELCEAAQFSSDFAWTWARFGAADDTPEELVLLDGQCLRFAGQELMRATQRAGYVWARRAGNEWVVETDIDSGVSVQTIESVSYVRN